MTKALAKDSTLNLKIEKSKFSKGDNDVVDAIEWVPGIKPAQDRDGSIVLVYVNGAINPEPKMLNEARGLITADYQNFLEKVWLEELRNKYNVEINEDVFNKMVR
jgi:peptidyl-prolyl cis-trans isomerase SurA